MEKQDIKILVVEDEEIIRKLFQQSFQHWGYQVDTAENGKIALEKFRQSEYHILVTDLNMPELNGLELLSRVKDKWPFVEVVVVTGFATVENALGAMKKGAYDFILKPVNLEYVHFTIDKCAQKILSQAENAELRQVNQQLRQLNELKDKFLYITNHEIRTPLTIIKGYLEILEALVDQRDPDVEETVQILKETTEDLVDIVERMHMLGDLEKSSLAGRVEVFDVKKLLTRVYRSVFRLYESRKIELRVLADKGALFVRADRQQLNFVFLELLQNALKFSPDGSKVEARLEKKGEELHYTVKDNGIGIPFEKQDTIFEKFYEVQDSTNHRTSRSEFLGGGLGIGLSLVKEIVQSMGGKILVTSEPGSGSTFKVILPITVNSEVGEQNASRTAAQS